MSSKAAQAAIWPAPSSEFFQSWFDFYPLYAAETGGKQLVEDGKATFNDAAGKAVANFWATMYAKGYAPKEKYTGDSFADGKAAMAIVGPWAIAVYGDKVNWGVAPVPTSTGKSADEIHTFSDAKNVGDLLRLQGPGHGVGRAEVRHQQGAGRHAARARPARCRCAPTSTTAYPDYFAGQPGVQGVRRAGGPHRRGAQRGQLDRDLADVPRRVHARR